MITIRPKMPGHFYGQPIPEVDPPPKLELVRHPVVEATVPEGVQLISAGKPVTGSDDSVIGDYGDLTDGQKDPGEEALVWMAGGTQWVQVDLGYPREIWLLWLWRNYAPQDSVIHKDVVLQISDDSDSRTATTVFNNDHDDSSGFGAGKEPSYFESSSGRCIPVSGVMGRYVRFWSRGQNIDGINTYTEIEVYGK